MDERSKESISALMDDEANELEIQRLLSKADSKELLDTWAGYHRVRDVMHGMRDARLDIDIAKGVAAKVAAQDMQGEELSADRFAGVSKDLSEDPKITRQADQGAVAIEDSKTTQRTGWLRYGGGAVAACLMVALATMLNLDNDPVVSDQLVSDNSGVAQNEEYQLVVNQVAPDDVSRVNEYLLRHAERSSVSFASTMTPLVRVASVNSIGI